MPLAMTETERAIAQEVARFDREVVTAEGVAQKSIKLLNRLVDGLTNEAFGDTETALKNRIVPESLVKKLKDMQSCLTAATAAEVALRKTIKLRSQELTPEQRKAGTLALILKMPWQERRDFIEDLIGKHNAQRTFELTAGIDMATKKNALFAEVL